MNTYIAVVFHSDAEARLALRKLWVMDEAGDLTVHGAAVVRRDDQGHIRVADRSSDLGMSTAIGVGVGALLGLLAGPVGVAAGIAGAASLSVGAAAGVGAMAGAAIGITADAVKEDRRETAIDEAFFTLKHGQSAMVAEISEDYTALLDDAMQPLGGTVYRCLNTAATNAAFGDSYYSRYLYPYDYPPMGY
ncbi:hypothetical protein NX862_14400 [Rhodobacter sp. KR11]|uniref:hypothetical protein n=1 Tax=Rhodobacter sp. KR11 TaxID=2974588 RepID=UPI0022237D8D|nr:hypothetical protein [Rhodobacter sp. KR11]MCW1919948.1 hypothetical protein [Rhodobacter sp. KR11]